MEHARILIIESDSDHARSISEALLEAGHHPVAEVSSAAAAMDRVRSHRPDLVLVSINPDTEAETTTVAERIRLELDIPVVFLCQPGEVVRVVRAASASASGLLLKPLQRGQLLCAIGTALATHAADTQAMAREARSRFLGDLNHVVRTPLHAVLGLAELLGDTDLSTDQRECLASINTSVRTLVDSVYRLLDDARVEAGDVNLDLAPIRVGEIVDSVFARFHDQAEEIGLELVGQVSCGADGSLLGDAGRIRQVLTGLVANALAMTPEGEVRLEASCDPRAAGAMTSRVCFRVIDTGVGIPSDRHEGIFSERRTGGLAFPDGIENYAPDLATCASVVEILGGKLRLESSRPGRGSVFRFELDLRRGASPTAAAPGQSARPSGDHGDNGAAAFSARVLVVDDDEENGRITVRMLEGDGHRLDWVENGKKAVEHAAETDYDLILMDLEMPVCDGVTATRMIRDWESRHGLRRSPIIAISAHTLDQNRSRCLDAGMDAFAEKPVQRGTLRALLRKWCDPRPLVVVVDTVQDQKQITESILRSSRRYAVVSSDSVEGALLTLRRATSATVVLDMDAADAAALPIARAIKKEFGQAVPILAIAGLRDADARRRSLQAGCDHFLDKPLMRREFLKALDDLVPTAPRAAAATRGKAADLAKIVVEVDPDIADMVPEYLASRRVETHELAELLEQGRFEKIKSLAHNLKGSAGAYGFTGLGEIAQRLEKAAVSMNRDEIFTSLVEITDYLGRVELKE